MSELHDRVAVLEQIAADTREVLADIRTELRGLRADLRSDTQQLRGETQALRNDLRADFRWLLRLIIGGFVGTWALLAHGLHWF